MRKESPARSLKSDSSAMLLERLFGKGATKSLAAFLAKSPAEKALAVSKSRFRTQEIKIDALKRTALAVSRVRRKQLVSAERVSLTLAGQLTEVSTDRDLLLTANTELLARTAELELSADDQKRMSQSASETNTLIAECARALIEADPVSFKRIFKSPESSASRILASSIVKIYNPRPLPGGKSKS